MSYRKTKYQKQCELHHEELMKTAKSTETITQEKLDGMKESRIWKFRDTLQEYEYKHGLFFKQNEQLLERMLYKIGKIRLTPYVLAVVVELVSWYKTMYDMELRKDVNGKFFPNLDEKIFGKPNYDILDALEEELREIKNFQDTRRKIRVTLEKRRLKIVSSGCLKWKDRSYSK